MTEAGATTPVRVPQWTFGDRLRKVRRELGDTQTAFAARLGESSKTYSNWEADRHPPASIVAVAKRIELATGVPASWVLGLDVPAPLPPRDAPSPAKGAEATTLRFSPDTEAAVIELPSWGRAA